MDGGFVAGSVLGWNFGEGQLHNEQLIDALPTRCRFEPVRVVILEGRPPSSLQRRDRLVDAATGIVETGHVAMADLVDRRPSCTEIPVVEDRPAATRGRAAHAIREPESTRRPIKN